MKKLIIFASVCAVLIVLIIGYRLVKHELRQERGGETATTGQATEAGEAPEAVVVGEAEWSYAMQSALGGKDEMDGVSIDTKGNVILGGPFQYTVDFNGVKRTAKSGVDIWVSKLSPTGEELWFTSIDSGGDDFAWDITTDQNDDIWISGGYGGTLTVNGKTYDAQRDGSALYAKLDSETGAILWVQTAGVITAGGAAVDSERTAGGNEIKIDSKGNAVAILSASGSEYTIGDMTFKRAGVMDSFIVKLSPQGEFLWAYQFLGEGRKQARAIGVAQNDSIVFGHQLIGEIDSREGFRFETSGRRAQGVAGLLSSDGKLLWMVPVASDGMANVRGAGGDSEGGMYFTGMFTGDAAIDGTPVAGVGKTSAFLTKFTAEGDLAWIRVLGDEGDDGGELVVDRANRIVISGGNQGEQYSVYDEEGAVIARNIHTADYRVARPTWTIFNPAGFVLGAYASTYADGANGGVLEAGSDGCYIFQFAFYGRITFENGESYLTENSNDPDTPDKDVGAVKTCFAF